MENQIYRVKKIFRQDTSGHWFNTGVKDITNTVGNALIGEDNREEILIGAFIPNKKKMDKGEYVRLRNIHYKGEPRN